MKGLEGLGFGGKCFGSFAILLEIISPSSNQIQIHFMIPPIKLYLLSQSPCMIVGLIPIMFTIYTTKVKEDMAYLDIYTKEINKQRYQYA